MVRNSRAACKPAAPPSGKTESRKNKDSIMRSILATFLLMLTPSVCGWSQAGKPTGDISGIWMPNVNYTTFWEPYEGPWTADKFVAYDKNVPRPRMGGKGAPAQGAKAAAV